jgi:hypothetical protein
VLHHARNQGNKHAKCGDKNYPEPGIIQPVNAADLFDRLIIDIDRLLFQSDSLLVDCVKISK